MKSFYQRIYWKHDFLSFYQPFIFLEYKMRQMTKLKTNRTGNHFQTLSLSFHT